MDLRSPCIKVCIPDNENVYCTGCDRTLDEIREWWVLSDEDKRKILERIARDY